ncbi:DMT family transporter [Acuticoccus mangrovi]|uniref:QacE family quaternary ammonium compound efflux SMR transporter n=1 Tax=Acuticoccus mangrovi TaxID=2796142 RepID=A0A934ICS6_9HYPH|nr:QacE family quaternary ammonium compound efflux SMR transporter [Acuticoccus mangrovi]
MNATHLLLGTAIVLEVIATMALSRSAGFTRLVPSLITILGYALALWLLTFPMRTMPTGVVYAIWGGLGVVLVTAIGWFRYGEALDAPAMMGIGLIIAGVVVINLFSSTVGH